MTNSLVDWFNTLPTAVLLLSALFGVGWLVLRLSLDHKSRRQLYSV